MLEVSRTDTAVPLITTIRDASGFISGQTMTQAVYDPATDQWLNMSTGAWQASKSTAAKTEAETGIFRVTADISQANAGSRLLVGVGDVTAGSAAGSVDVELLVLRDNVEPPTAIETRDAILNRVLPGNHDTADSVGAQLQAVTAGGVSTAQLRDALLNALLSDYDSAGTVGELFNSTNLAYLDTQVQLLATALASIGLPILNTNRTLYAGQKGETHLFQFYQDEAAMPDSVLGDANTVQIVFHPLSGGADVTVTAQLYTGGKAGYTTVLGDGVLDTAGEYTGQAIASMPDTTKRYSEQRRFTVEDPL